MMLTAIALYLLGTVQTIALVQIAEDTGKANPTKPGRIVFIAIWPAVAVVMLGMMLTNNGGRIGGDGHG